VLDERAVLNLGLLQRPRALPDLFLEGRIETLQFVLERIRLGGLLFQPLHHAIEPTGQLGDLLRPGDRDALRVIPVDESLGRIGEVAERRGDPAREVPADGHPDETEQHAEDHHPHGQATHLGVDGVVGQADTDVTPGLVGTLDQDRHDRLEGRRPLGLVSRQVDVARLRFGYPDRKLGQVDAVLPPCAGDTRERSFLVVDRDVVQVRVVDRVFRGSLQRDVVIGQQRRCGHRADRLRDREPARMHPLGQHMLEPTPHDGQRGGDDEDHEQRRGQRIVGLQAARLDEAPDHRTTSAVLNQTRSSSSLATPNGPGRMPFTLSCVASIPRV